MWGRRLQPSVVYTVDIEQGGLSELSYRVYMLTITIRNKWYSSGVTMEELTPLAFRRITSYVW